MNGSPFLSLPSTQTTRPQRERREQDKRSASGGATPASFDRSTLRNVRVVQRNLVYVIGLPPAIALEETLRKPEYFGQYGRIVKVRE